MSRNIIDFDPVVTSVCISQGVCGFSAEKERSEKRITTTQFVCVCVCVCVCVLMAEYKVKVKIIRPSCLLSYIYIFFFLRVSFF